MAEVYVLRSLKDKKFYIGCTRDTAHIRLNKHNQGSVRSTKGRRPFELLHAESFDTFTAARKKKIITRRHQDVVI